MFVLLELLELGCGQSKVDTSLEVLISARNVMMVSLLQLCFQVPIAEHPPVGVCFGEAGRERHEAACVSALALSTVLQVLELCHCGCICGLLGRCFSTESNEHHLLNLCLASLLLTYLTEMTGCCCSAFVAWHVWGLSHFPSVQLELLCSLFLREAAKMR